MTRKKPKAPQVSPGAPRPRRRTAEFTVPIKLWVSGEMFAQLEAMATEHEWTVPQVVRRAVRELFATPKK